MKLLEDRTDNGCMKKMKEPALKPTPFTGQHSSKSDYEHFGLHAKSTPIDLELKITHQLPVDGISTGQWSQLNTSSSGQKGQSDGEKDYTDADAHALWSRNNIPSNMNKGVSGFEEVSSTLSAMNAEKEVFVVENQEPLQENSGRERLKRHRVEVAGRVWIPDIWGQEELLKDWIDCTAFDSFLVPQGIKSARAALIQEGKRASSDGLSV